MHKDILKPFVSSWLFLKLVFYISLQMIWFIQWLCTSHILRSLLLWTMWSCSRYSQLPYVAVHKPCTFATWKCTQIFLPMPQKSSKLKSADRFGHFLSCGLSEFELVNWLLWDTTEFSHWTLMQIKHWVIQSLIIRACEKIRMLLIGPISCEKFTPTTCTGVSFRNM